MFAGFSLFGATKNHEKSQINEKMKLFKSRKIASDIFFWTFIYFISWSLNFWRCAHVFLFICSLPSFRKKIIAHQNQKMVCYKELIKSRIFKFWLSPPTEPKPGSLSFCPRDQFWRLWTTYWCPNVQPENNQKIMIKNIFMHQEFLRMPWMVWVLIERSQLKGVVDFYTTKIQCDHLVVVSCNPNVPHLRYRASPCVRARLEFGGF